MNYKMKVNGFTGRIKKTEEVELVDITHGVATVTSGDRKDFVMKEDLEDVKRLSEPDGA